MSVSPERLARYEAALEEGGADAFVLTSEPAVQHAAGVRLYTMRLIPQRPVVCVLAPPRPPVVVCVTYETDQLAAAHPQLELRPFRELGDDPWAVVADALGAARDVIVEDTMPVAWAASLRGHLPDTRVRHSYELPVAPRLIKDDREQELLRFASQAAEQAIAAGAELVTPGRSEREIADAVRGSFLAQLSERAGEVSGICAGPTNNLAMHHTATAAPMPERGPVRLGIVGRVDGYWVLLTRMLRLNDVPELDGLYQRYCQVYEETMASLRPGEPLASFYQACREQLADQGFTLSSDKIGHGTGLDFREPPVLSADATGVLSAGTVLAYDYAIEPVGGAMLHVEDRVLVTATGAERLSDGWDLRDLAAGYRSLL